MGVPEVIDLTGDSDEEDKQSAKKPRLVNGGGSSSSGGPGGGGGGGGGVGGGGSGGQNTSINLRRSIPVLLKVPKKEKEERAAATGGHTKMPPDRTVIPAGGTGGAATNTTTTATSITTSTSTSSSTSTTAAVGSGSTMATLSSGGNSKSGSGEGSQQPERPQHFGRAMSGRMPVAPAPPNITSVIQYGYNTSSNNKSNNDNRFGVTYGSMPASSNKDEDNGGSIRDDEIQQKYNEVRRSLTTEPSSVPVPNVSTATVPRSSTYTAVSSSYVPSLRHYNNCNPDQSAVNKVRDTGNNKKNMQQQSHPQPLLRPTVFFPPSPQQNFLPPVEHQFLRRMVTPATTAGMEAGLRQQKEMHQNPVYSGPSLGNSTSTATTPTQNFNRSVQHVSRPNRPIAPAPVPTAHKRRGERILQQILQTTPSSSLMSTSSTTSTAPSSASNPTQQTVPRMQQFQQQWNQPPPPVSQSFATVRTTPSPQAKQQQEITPRPTVSTPHSQAKQQNPPMSTVTTFTTPPPVQAKQQVPSRPTMSTTTNPPPLQTQQQVPPHTATSSSTPPSLQAKQQVPPHLTTTNPPPLQAKQQVPFRPTMTTTTTTNPPPLQAKQQVPFRPATATTTPPLQTQQQVPPHTATSSSTPPSLQARQQVPRHPAAITSSQTSLQGKQQGPPNVSITRTATTITITTSEKGNQIDRDTNLSTNPSPQTNRPSPGTKADPPTTPNQAQKLVTKAPEPKIIQQQQRKSPPPATTTSLNKTTTVTAVNTAPTVTRNQTTDSITAAPPSSKPDRGESLFDALGLSKSAENKPTEAVSSSTSKPVLELPRDRSMGDSSEQKVTDKTDRSSPISTPPPPVTPRKEGTPPLIHSTSNPTSVPGGTPVATSSNHSEGTTQPQHIKMIIRNSSSSSASTEILSPVSTSKSPSPTVFSPSPVVSTRTTDAQIKYNNARRKSSDSSERKDEVSKAPGVSAPPTITNTTVTSSSKLIEPIPSTPVPNSKPGPSNTPTSGSKTGDKNLEGSRKRSISKITTLQAPILSPMDPEIPSLEVQVPRAESGIPCSPNPNMAKPPKLIPQVPMPPPQHIPSSAAGVTRSDPPAFDLRSFKIPKKKDNDKDKENVKEKENDKDKSKQPKPNVNTSPSPSSVSSNKNDIKTPQPDFVFENMELFKRRHDRVSRVGPDEKTTLLVTRKLSSAIHKIKDFQNGSATRRSHRKFVTARTCTGFRRNLNIPATPSVTVGRRRVPKAEGRSRGPGKQNNITAEQLKLLEAKFRTTQELSPADVLELAFGTGLDKAQVQAWFKQRRKHATNAGQESSAGVTDTDEDVEEIQVDESDEYDFPDDEPEEPQPGPSGAIPRSQKVNSSYASPTDSEETIAVSGFDLQLWCESTRDKKFLKHFDLRTRDLRILRADLARVEDFPINFFVDPLLYLWNDKAIKMFDVLDGSKDEKSTIMREARRIKDKFRCDPFSEEQHNLFDAWREEFLKEMSTKNGKTIDENAFIVDEFIIPWRAVFFYSRISMEGNRILALIVGLEDFCRIFDGGTHYEWVTPYLIQ